MSAATRILAVDDDRLVRMNLSLTLGREGFAVDTASSFDEARDLLAREVYDLVLTDLDLAGADGLELARLALSGCPSAKVILVTGSASDLCAESARQAGIEAILVKPFALRELLDLVRRSIGWAAHEGEA